MVFKESAWKGSIDVTKPTEHSNGTVNRVRIDWDVEDVPVSTYLINDINIHEFNLKLKNGS